jgi:hypothetical protein
LRKHASLNSIEWNSIFLKSYEFSVHFPLDGGLYCI